MIKWCDHLYMDQRVKKKFNKYKTSLEKDRLTLGLYCVILPSNENNMFDIISSNELLFRYYRRRNIYIVGLAITKESAIRLVQTILEDVYRDTKDVKVKEYFSFC